MYISSSYMNAIDELKAESMQIAGEAAKIQKAIEQDEIFDHGDWTNNDFALALDDLKQDLHEFEHYLDLAIEELDGVIEREKVRL